METLKMIALIYWVGYIVAYVIIRLMNSTTINGSEEGYLGTRVKLSLLSWLTVSVLLVFILGDLYENINK